MFISFPFFRQSDIQWWYRTQHAMVWLGYFFKKLVVDPNSFSPSSLTLDLPSYDQSCLFRRFCYFTTFLNNFFSSKAVMALVSEPLSRKKIVIGKTFRKIWLRIPKLFRTVFFRTWLDHSFYPFFAHVISEVSFSRSPNHFRNALATFGCSSHTPATYVMLRPVILLCFFMAKICSSHALATGQSIGDLLWLAASQVSILKKLNDWQFKILGRWPFDC